MKTVWKIFTLFGFLLPLLAVVVLFSVAVIGGFVTWDIGVFDDMFINDMKWMEILEGWRYYLVFVFFLSLTALGE